MKSKVHLQDSNNREPGQVRAGLLEQVENGLEAGYRVSDEQNIRHKAAMGAPTTAPKHRLHRVLLKESVVRLV